MPRTQTNQPSICIIHQGVEAVWKTSYIDAARHLIDYYGLNSERIVSLTEQLEGKLKKRGDELTHPDLAITLTII